MVRAGSSHGYIKSAAGDGNLQRAFMTGRFEIWTLESQNKLYSYESCKGRTFSNVSKIGPILRHAPSFLLLTVFLRDIKTSLQGLNPRCGCANAGTGSPGLLRKNSWKRGGA